MTSQSVEQTAITGPLTSGSLTIEVTSPDPAISEMLATMDLLGADDPVRHECEAMLYESLAENARLESDRLIREAAATG